MDSKQFDELVARLASAATRRGAVKGVIGGALTSVGVTSIASAKKDKNKKDKKKKCKRKPKQTICHKGQTITVSQCAVNKHINRHGDTLGPCPYGR